MSLITTLSDENNSFLSRREITCDFKGLGGKLKKLEAIEMIIKEFKLGEKFVIPIKLRTHTGQSKTTGIFYIYDDEALAKKHVNPVIFTRLERAKTNKEKQNEVKTDEKPTKSESPDDKVTEVKTDEKPTKSESPDDKVTEVKKDEAKSS